MTTTSKAIIASLLSLLSLTASAYTVTFDAGTGVCDTTEITSDNSIKLPVATHTNSEYSFIGWSTVKKTTEDNKFPTDLLAAGSQYTNDKDVTLFAVYSRKQADYWQRTTIGNSLEPGIYILITQKGQVKNNAFNGIIDKEGHGETTSNTFTFDNNEGNGKDRNCPNGACELIFTKNGNGYSIQKDYYSFLTSDPKGLVFGSEPCTWTINDKGLVHSNGNIRSDTKYSYFYHSTGGYAIALAHKITTYTSTPPTSFAMSVSGAGYSTFYSSKNAFTMPEGMAGYVVSWNKESKNISLTRKYESEAIVPADEPLVLKATPGNYTLNYVSSDAQSLKNAEPTGNILIGTDVESEATTGDANNDSNYYFYSLSLNADNDINSVGFYWVADGGAPFNVPAHKAYLALEKSLFPNGAKMMSFAFSDYETDGIASVFKDSAEEATLYNTMGQRVSNTTKGIVIRNGRKYINK